MTPHHLKTAYYNLRSSTLRTILAMLGILVGTGAVVAMVSTGQMATEEALRQFKNLGTDLMSISLSTPNDKGKLAAEGERKFNLDDANDIKNASSDILVLAPYTSTYTNLTYRGNPIRADVVGATNNLARVVNIQVKQGRFISPFERYERYCVIGSKVQETLKDYTNDPLYTKIKLGDQIYTIIGILYNFPENSFLNQDINNSVIIPILTVSFLAQSMDINNIIMRIKTNANIDNVKKSIETYLTHKEIKKELYFRSAKELVKSMEAQHQIFTLLLTLIGSISLLVGGIGVMNIMLVSVLERRREIGIRLALGARRKEIQWMFLTEAILLSVIGGGLGVVTGLFCSFIVALFFHWNFVLFLIPPLIGFTVSVFIGVFFGYYPAYKAAKLDPIQTLRAE